MKKYKAIPRQYIIAPGTMVYGISTIKRPGAIYFTSEQLELLHAYYGVNKANKNNKTSIEFKDLIMLILADRQNAKRQEFLDKFNDIAFNTKEFDPDNASENQMFVMPLTKPKIIDEPILIDELEKKPKISYQQKCLQAKKQITHLPNVQVNRNQIDTIVNNRFLRSGDDD